MSTPKPCIISIPFDRNSAPRAQITAALATTKARVCPRHPFETLAVDAEATIRAALHHHWPNEQEPLSVSCEVSYARCPQCPLSDPRLHLNGVDGCPADVLRVGNRHLGLRDRQGVPLPRHSCTLNLEADRPVNTQLKEWQTALPEIHCDFGGEHLVRQPATILRVPDSLRIEPQFFSCLQCGLESLGIEPDLARASFANFEIDPPEIQTNFKACRDFAAAPLGTLFLAGNCGAGKTHLAVAIMRDLLGQGRFALLFIKHRHFLAQYRESLRPVAFGTEPSENPLARCQKAGLLVYDDLTASTDSRSYEEVLLDLFELRLGRFMPTVITTNLHGAELETVLGSRLLDRFRRGSFALLEFGFESKRASFNKDYLLRSADAQVRSRKRR